MTEAGPALPRSRPVRTPVVLQMEAVECGAACLAIVMGHFGRHVPLEELRIACGVSRDGSTAGSMVRVAEAHGLEAAGYRQDVDEVLAGPLPSVVLWNSNHFLVVEGAQGDQVRLNDPAHGRRKVSLAEFATGYSGIVLTFAPGPGFQRGGRPPRPVSRLVAAIAARPGRLAFVLATGVLLAVPAFALPAFTAIFVDEILVRGRPWLAALAVLLLLGIGLQAVLGWLQGVALLRLELRTTAEQATALAGHMLRLPLMFYAQRHLGDLAARAAEVPALARLTASGFGLAAVNLVTAVLLLALMAVLDPVLAAVAAAGALASLLVLVALQRARLDLSIRLQADTGRLFATTVIGIRSIETLKANADEDGFFARWAGHQARKLNSEQGLAVLEQASGIAQPLIAMLTIAAALALGGLRVLDGVLSLGALLAFQALFAALAGPLQQVVATASQSQRAAAGLLRIDDVARHPPDWRHEAAAPAPDMDPPAGPAALRLEGLRFRFNPQAPPLIDGFDLDLRPGRWVALVGATGSGKSTLGRLATGLYRPEAGRILLDGRPLHDWPRDALARRLATVDQEIALFAGSLRDNITLWDPHVPAAALDRAVGDAALAQLLAGLPGGLDSRVDEDGRNFSGGERQRIELARALVRDPALLVLDEGTSALDPVTEAAVMAALRRRGLSCLVIAHRLSTVRDCDEIIVMARGRIAERGDHAALLAAGGPYARMLAAEGAGDPA